MSIFVEREHQGRLPGPHRVAGPVLRPAQPRLRHPGGGRHQPQEGGHRRRGHPHLRHRRRGGEGDGRHRRRACSSPRPASRRAVIEAAEGGVELVVVITEGVPAHDEARFYNRLRRDFPGTRLLGPNCPGIITPGRVQHRHHRGRDRQGGRAGRHRQPLGHAHLPGALRAEAAGHRRHHLRRHRRRPGAGHDVHRLPRRLRGRPRRPRPSS